MSEGGGSVQEKWARMRFSVVGHLLASPPERGELKIELRRLAEKVWRHPIQGGPVRFGLSTIEGWYYRARAERRDPVGVLRAKVRKDAGDARSLPIPVRDALRVQHAAHPTWSYQLHVDNLVAHAEQEGLGEVPSYWTVRRYMKSHGLFRARRKRPRGTEGAERAAERFENFETRSFETAYVFGLWHLDFHQGSRKVITPQGMWVPVHLLAVLDDHSRLGCHAQWYFDEQAESLVHGLSQAFQKRGLPRACLMDNGSAMVAGEVTEGFEDLGILHETTLPRSPNQNGKQEVFFASVEGRLISMLEGVQDLTIEVLNEATQAWLELEYNRATHREIGMAPYRRFLDGRSVGRECPSSEGLRRAFRMRTDRTQRRGDGTVSVEGVRFEVPSRYRHVEKVTLRYARWDFRSIDIVDPRTGKVVCTCFPQDKEANAEGTRRRMEPVLPAVAPPSAPAQPGIAPLLKKLMAAYAATGLPPAYIPKHKRTEEEESR